jgi:hypothetical protein
MTISSTTRIAGPFIGNGTASAFPFTFKVFAATDLDVIKLTVSTGTESTLVLTTDYTVSLNGDQNSNPGGTVTLTAGALASGFTLTITSDIANLQPTDLTNQGGFYPEVITDSLDRATIQIQQIADIGDRTLKIPISDGTLNMELPTKTERANSFLSFDANGLPSVVTAGSSGAPATITRQVFSGTGSQTVFTLASDPGALGNSAQVYIGGVYQQRSTYTIAGTTLTFSAAPVAGTDNIEFVNFLTSNIGATSADLVTYTPSGTGAVARSAASKFGDVVSLKDFGAVGDNVADDTAALNAALAFCNTNSRTLFIPSGNYKITSNITVPVAPSTGRSFGIIGEGKHFEQSVLRFTGASVTTGLTLQSPIGTYQYRGLFSGFMLYFSSGATGGMTISYAHHPEVNSICVYNTVGGAGSPGLTLDNCNAPRVSNCLMLGCGSSTKGAMYLNKCTVAYVDCNYLSGQVFAGIQVERGTATLQSNAIESSGYLILAGEESESTFATNIYAFSNNLENPTGSYIRVGQGVTGGAASATSATIRDNVGSPSGSTSINHCIDIGSIGDVEIVNNSFGGETVSTIAIGSQNTRCRIPSQFGLYRNPTTVPYITIGGVHLSHATALATLDVRSGSYGLAQQNQSITVSTAIIQNALVNGGGGLYSRLYLTTPSAQTVTNTLNYPPSSLSNFATGMEITLIPTDGNLTLAHASGGLGSFHMTGAANLTLTANSAYRFMYNLNTGRWTQI